MEEISEKLKLSINSIAVTTGTDRILRIQALIYKKSFEKVNMQEENCNKETEGVVTMNTYSRGHLFFVSSSGIIMEPTLSK